MGDAFNIAELFSGAGGLGLGIERVVRGARTVVHVEREAFACAVLASRMEEGRLASAPIWTDVCTFDGRAWRGVLDCLAFGSPCQDLSLAGKRAGLDGERSGLFFEGLRIAVEAEVPLVFWENVGGAGGALHRVFDAFEAAGYSGKACSLRASDVGASHERLRYFVLAHRDDQGKRQRQGLNSDLGRWPGDCGEEVADSDDARCSVHRGAVGIPEEHAPTAIGSHPLAFPPGQDDYAAWASVLALRPDLAPAEPKVFGNSLGVPRGLDGGLLNGSKSEDECAADLRALWNSARSQKIWRETRGFRGLPSADALLQCVRKFEGGREDHGPLCAREEASQEELRTLRNSGEGPSAPPKRSGDRRPAGEHRDALRVLPHEVALECRQALNHAAWADRVRMMGNSCVPAQAAAAFALLLNAIGENQ